MEIVSITAVPRDNGDSKFIIYDWKTSIQTMSENVENDTAMQFNYQLLFRDGVGSVRLMLSLANYNAVLTL